MGDSLVVVNFKTYQTAHGACAEDLARAMASRPVEGPSAADRRATSNWSRAPVAARKLATMANNSDVMARPVPLLMPGCLR